MPVPYHEVATKLFASGTIANGVFGARAECSFALVDNKIVAVHSFGYHEIGLPDATDATEAVWLLNNHPNSRAEKVRMKP